MIYREQFMPEAPAADFTDLLSAKDSGELRKRLSGYIDEHSESEADLTALVEALHAFEPAVFSDIAATRQKYEAMLDGRKLSKAKLSKLQFSGYLREYLRQAIKTMAVRAVDSRTTREARAAEEKLVQEAAQARQEARSREQAEAVEIEKLVPVIRQEILTEMQQRTPHFDHSPEHQASIREVQQNMKRGILHGASSDREHGKAVSERELLLGALMEGKKLFGPEAIIYHTDKYDDYAQQADLAVKIDNGPTILIDLTGSEKHAGQKLYYNQQNPVRILEYPPHQDLADKRGMPIVIGMSEADAEESIGQFLKSEAKERLGIKPEVADQKIYQESFGRWIEYVLLQLEHQQNYMLEHSQDIEDDDLLTDFNYALKEYREAIEYFKQLKKERYPFVKLNERRSWDEKMLSISSQIRDYEVVAGLPDEPPYLPELARAA